MEKDHGMTEVGKHSTSTETMFFEKVSIVLFITRVYLGYCDNKMEITTTKMLFIQLNHVHTFNFILSSLTTLTGKEGPSEFWGVWQLPALSAHLQSRSNIACWAGAASHTISWVSLKKTHKTYTQSMLSCTLLHHFLMLSFIINETLYCSHRF